MGTLNNSKTEVAPNKTVKRATENNQVTMNAIRQHKYITPVL
jgi:hypothetical protein